MPRYETLERSFLKNQSGGSQRPMRANRFAEAFTAEISLIYLRNTWAMSDGRRKIRSRRVKKYSNAIYRSLTEPFPEVATSEESTGLWHGAMGNHRARPFTGPARQLTHQRSRRWPLSSAVCSD